MRSFGVWMTSPNAAAGCSPAPISVAPASASSVAVAASVSMPSGTLRTTGVEDSISAS